MLEPTAWIGKTIKAKDDVQCVAPVQKVSYVKKLYLHLPLANNILKCFNIETLEWRHDTQHNDFQT